MRDVISAENTVILSDRIGSRLGLHFPEDRWDDLLRGVGEAARELGYSNLKSYVDHIIAGGLARKDIETLARHLTVGETYFFRDPAVFRFLEETVLPKLIGSRRDSEKRLRIWSAGCCTGEEPYSLAITVGKFIPDFRTWNVTLLATDVNQEFLRKAAAGIYGRWSFRETPTRVMEKYFRPSGKSGQFEVLPAYRNAVTFSFHNLAADAYPSLSTNTNAMDIIVCRNVLMYFERRRARKIVKNLYDSLVEGGWLIVSPTESFQLQGSMFIPVIQHGGIFYLKDSKQKPDHDSVVVPERYIEVRPPVGKVTDAPPRDAQPRLRSGDERHADETSASDPPFPEFLHEKAVQAYKRGKYEDAKADLMRLFVQLPHHAPSLALLARIHANEGNLPAAIEACKGAVSVDRLNPEFYYLHATILLETGSFDEAAKSLNTALYLEAGFVLAHFLLGSIARQSGAFEESDRHLQNALSALKAYRPEDTVLGGEGMTAGRLIEIIKAELEMEQVS